MSSETIREQNQFYSRNPREGIKSACQLSTDRSLNLVMVCDRTAENGGGGGGGGGDAACGLVKYICHDNYISIHGQKSLFTLLTETESESF